MENTAAVRKARLWEAANHMRQHHGEGHPRQEFWFTLASILDHVAQTWYGQPTDMKSRMHYLAVDYLATIATPAELRPPTDEELVDMQDMGMDLTDEQHDRANKYREEH